VLHYEVVARIRQMLLDGEIPPGAKVPEKELSMRLAISRTPLREALKVLAAEHLVVLTPNRGARAALLTLENVRDLFELCGSLEALAGELACARISQEALAEIDALHAQMMAAYQAGALADYYRANRAIHEAIVTAAGNRELSAVYETVAARIRRVRFVAPPIGDHWRLAVLEHEAILNCLHRRDSAAIGLILRNHLRNRQMHAESAGFAEPGAAPRRRRRRPGAP
jgi:DNA-binding GntR family transcriptional regulator